VGQDARFRGERHVAFGSLICGCAVARPFACFGAFVCCLGSVVEAELSRSGVSEVALGRLRATEGHLAVRAYCFYVAGGHFAEGLGLAGWVGVLGGHDGR
jgi:hypothetical protein